MGTFFIFRKKSLSHAIRILIPLISYFIISCSILNEAPHIHYISPQERIGPLFNGVLEYDFDYADIPGFVYPSYRMVVLLYSIVFLLIGYLQTVSRWRIFKIASAINMAVLILIGISLLMAHVAGRQMFRLGLLSPHSNAYFSWIVLFIMVIILLVLSHKRWDFKHQYDLIKVQILISIVTLIASIMQFYFNTVSLIASSEGSNSWLTECRFHPSMDGIAVGITILLTSLAVTGILDWRKPLGETDRNIRA